VSAPTVSVVIAAYNCAGYLPDAVESVRSQTYEDYEVIIVDDGSTDETWRAIEELAASWPRIRPLRAEHAGTPANKNRGMFAARGEWIALLDADDIWLPEKLQRCMDFLAEHPDLSIVYTPMAVARLDTGEVIKGHSKKCHAGRLTEKIFHSIFVHDPAVVFHRRVLDECGGMDEEMLVGSGHEFWLRVSLKFEFGLIDEPLARRRWSQSSLTRSNRSRGRRLKARMLERFYLEHGDILARRKARARLSRVHCAAGRMLLAEADPSEAREFLAKAIRYNPANLKAYPFYVAACLAALLRPLPGRRSSDG